MEIIKRHNSKTKEEVSMQLDLKASTSQEESLTDHYIILRTLGKGTFAEVKLACHLHTEVQVAIKILENGENNDHNNRTEIDIVKTLDHPNIIKVFHIINTEEHTYMVMEHASRGDLVSHIEKVGCLQEEQAQHIFTQIVRAVHYCHKNGIAHRDIKLDNILLDGKGNVKLCDFGMAIRVTSGQRSKGLCGTLEYCAPELFIDTEYDAKAVDIWSMGVVLYTMVTACFPFKARTYSDMKEQMLNPQYYIPCTLSQNIVNLIVQLFTVMPEQRPKISDIRQHQWFKDREEFWKLPLSSETYSTIPNPSLVVAMWGMGYDPKDISDCIREKKFNNIMATYLILKHESAQDHTNYAVKPMQACVAMSPVGALTSLPPQRRLSEPSLHTFALLDEHLMQDEKRSWKKGSRSLSMPTILGFQQKRDNPPHPVPKYSPEVTHLMNTLTVGSLNCKGLFSRCSFSEGISSPQYLSWEAPQEMNTLKNCTYTQRKPSVKKYREAPQGVTTTATHGTQRSSLQAMSENNFEAVPPEGITAPSASILSQGWKRVKKRIGNWVRLLCCCLSEKEVAPLEVESSAGTHMQ
ncbi:sperm motility kinase X-like [Peromyscus eremicus]|uniref:sperm motility kinase X-like n=1 Tax=Peromyscus eremicus TaxID=42410 RepID=UPI0027DC0940|nr:sperm motility kinase X-like [Peromyscus eremicus]